MAPPAELPPPPVPLTSPNAPALPLMSIELTYEAAVTFAAPLQACAGGERSACNVVSAMAVVAVAVRLARSETQAVVVLLTLKYDTAPATPSESVLLPVSAAALA